MSYPIDPRPQLHLHPLATLNAALQAGDRLGANWALALEQAPDLAERLRGHSLILDLDDTLTVNAPLFDHAREALKPVFSELAQIGGQSAPDAAQLIAAFNELDVSRIPEHGYNPQRWLGSCQIFAEQLAGRLLDEDERQTVLEAGEIALGVGVFYPGAEQALQQLTAAGADMMLLTKGEPAKQMQKIEAHSLRRFFGERIMIVPTKNAEVFAAHAKDLSGRICVIGDSPSSDILPALACGFDAIHVNHDFGCWEGDHEHDVVQVKSFAEAICHLIGIESPVLDLHTHDAHDLQLAQDENPRPDGLGRVF